MSISNSDDVTVHDLINSNALIAVIQSFFLTGQLSQFMEQTNPLAALTHKRRLSALGPGGLTRERAGFEVRDVHYSHYGRICPIETPEGPNIGLIASPAMYSRVNRLGFLETPYIKVENGKVINQVDYLDPGQEEKYTVAQANVTINNELNLTDELVFARKKGDFKQVPPSDIQYLEVSPQQIVSVSACLIPFLEHDDANRALMGCNMQRQAVPLLNPTFPIIGTGMEKIVARESGNLALAPFDGIVKRVTSAYIDIQRKGTEDLTLELNDQDRVYLKKFSRTNQDTCVNQRPIVQQGDSVVKGQVISDGPGIEGDRLALGQNMLVAFMPWYGYDPSPEENLMRALFGDRAGDFTNTSLKAKPGMEGVVIDVKVFSRLEDIHDYEEEKKENLNKIKNEHSERKKRVEDFLKRKLSRMLIGEVAKNISDKKTNMFFIPAGKKITRDDVLKINFKKLNLNYELINDEEKNQKIYNEIILKAKAASEENDNIRKKERDRLKHGDELPYGVRKMVKVYIAKKRKIQVGDKMAGRHGNKGVISLISPIEDMPFLDDGTSVDIILNPLGVPSRMNIGQILETHLGMAARILGFKVETPVFDGAKLEDIETEMKAAKLDLDGKHVLYDGKTGEAFKERVTVGIIYMLKLNHLVADKMHARSTGPYSLITQQPLGGKAQHGGQRLGEMEVWALEAYGASRLLEEMLTIKSDDVDGRTNSYKAITSGQNPPAPGIPESFNVLVSELKSLCFDIDFLADKDLEGGY